ncbi:MAG: NUDIX domain-containing protein [Flammeovirgaceae bacterium]|jgi:ADP-ribose pyrophosphatase YjhB (NUDIX family)|nr:NUDIX domain-containing protein [Flammeovirgaceae bacterium]
MNLFINDIPIRILHLDEMPPTGHINYELSASVEPITKAKLFHHVWIHDVSISDMDLILDLLNSKVPTNLFSLHLSAKDYDALKLFILSKFKVIKAAGGLVKKKDRLLMIYRMKKWDLPKGKKESGEKYKETATREVEEECNVKVKLGKKICTTWHTYTMNKNSMLKKTKWYEMDLLDDSKSKPSLEEDIEELRWMTQKEVYHALENSYKSIHFVFEQYYSRKERTA